MNSSGIEPRFRRLKSILRDPPETVALPAAFLHFEQLRKVGEGASAIVYQAVDANLDRPVAIKLLRESMQDSDVARKRFRREAEVLAGMTHPNIVKLHEIGEWQGRAFLVMELVTGRTLDQVLQEDAPPPQVLIPRIETIARGIHHAHQHGVVHRDLKPANIIISGSGEPKVMDFGLAHLDESRTALTQSGATLGTPLFMSPEQVAGHADRISARTDVYALGAILYLGLAGRTPHQGLTVAEIFGKILHETPRSPRRINPAIPADLETICLKALEKEPSRRYETAEALANDLRRHLDGAQIAARPVSTLGRTVRRNKAMLAALLIGGVAAGTILGVNVANLNRRAGALQRLSALWTTILERKRDLRQLKAPADPARAELEKAVAGVDSHVRDWPDDPQGYYVRARGKLYLDDLEGARKDLDTALTRWPDFRPGWSLLGMVNIGEFQERLWGTRVDWQDLFRDRHSPIHAAVEAFSKGWEPGQEENSHRWGLPWTREDQVIERLARAMKLYFSDRETGAAQRVLEEAALQYRAEEYALFRGLSDPDTASRLRWFDRAIEWAPGYGTGFMARANLKSRQGDFPGALADFDSAIGLKKDYAGAFSNRANIKCILGDRAGALSDYDSAIRLRKDFVEPYVNRARMKCSLGDFPGALADYDSAIELKRDFAEAYHGRGIVKHRQGNPSGALADYDQAIEFKRDYAAAYSARGDMKQSRGDSAAAMADYDIAIGLKKDFAEAYYARGNLKLNQGDPAAALADYDDAIRCRKDFTNAYYIRAQVRESTGDHPGALADFRKAIETADPGWQFKAEVELRLGGSKSQNPKPKT